MESSAPPTLTMATPSSEHLIPWADTAEPTDTEICRADRSIEASFWITGSTNTLAPMTTFWPDRSVLIDPVSGFVTGLPLRPVTMNASLGPATLIRDTTMPTMARTRTTRRISPMAMGPMAPFRWWFEVRCGHGSSAQNVSAASTTTRVDDSTATTTESVPRGRSSVAVALSLTG